MKATAAGGGHSDCAKKMELLVLTREEDFKELTTTIAEMQRLLSGRVEGLSRRITVLEETLARSRSIARSLRK